MSETLLIQIISWDENGQSDACEFSSRQIEKGNPR